MAQALTSLASFKRWYNLPQTNVVDDTLLTDIIADVSQGILTYLDRKSLLKKTFTDYLDGTGGPKLLLKQWPVLSVSSVVANSITLTAATQPNVGYFVDPWDGFPPGRMQYLNYIGGSTQGGSVCYGGAYFPAGVRNIVVTYAAGYSTVDEAQTAPSTSPYQLDADQDYGLWMQDDGVTINGTSATAITSGTPTTGQYKVESGKYTFAAADAGKAVLLSYSYIPSTLQGACNQMTGELYGYRQHIGQKSHTIQGNVTTAFDNSIMTAAIISKLQPFKRMVPW
jgi:hypothetical protein